MGKSGWPSQHASYEVSLENMHRTSYACLAYGWLTYTGTTAEKCSVQHNYMLLELVSRPRYSAAWAVLIWLGDLFLNGLIINYVPYTELDWTAYMEQVSQIIAGETNYLRIEGDTGPLVYPAGHVWIFRLLYYITDEGTNIPRAQRLFVGVYMVTLAVVLSIYVRAKVPPYVLPFLVLSKRLHSIYGLRLFNDCFETLAAVIAVFALQSRRWQVASLLFSLAVSIKMNALLFAPGVAVIIWRSTSFAYCIRLAIPVVLLQVAVAWPFVSTYPKEYFTRAFEFSRVFLYKWTVNWKFIPEETFLSHEFAASLLILHVSLLAVYMFRWFKMPRNQLAQPAVLVKIVALSNLIGILCARSLHYQFYSWFYWSFPFLLWTSGLNRVVAVVVWATQEYAWNSSSPLGSGLLVAGLALTLFTN